MDALMFTTVNTHLLPAADRHGFRPGHSTTSALLQLTNDIATSVDSYLTTSEANNQLQPAEALSRRQ